MGYWLLVMTVLNDATPIVIQSVHRAIKHDEEAHKRKGEPAGVYNPRAPLSERVAAAHKLEATRKEASHGASNNAIVSTEEEEDSEIYRDILSAVSKTASVSGSAAASMR